ncbi:MAG TPA: hypothetical protein VMY39_03330, partial [Planctomycetota bacterium]|nr:hypothetical protein [Planctomycetota bacterium]
MKSLGPPTLRIKLGLGLDTQPDATLLRELTDKRARSLRVQAIASGARVYPDHGALVVDNGTVAYSTATHKPIGVHRQGADSRILAAGASAGFYVDADGARGSWTTLSATLTPSRKSLVGRDGVTYAADEDAIPVKYTGSSTPTNLPDVPRPEDGMIEYQPEATDILIDAFEDKGNWTATGTGTAPVLSDETALMRYGDTCMKIVFTGDATGDRVDRNLGASATIDLSNSDFLSFWIRSDVAGDYFFVKISEDNSTWFTLPVHLADSDVDTWKLVIWDLTSIPAADRDAIRYIRMGMPETQACTIYLDHMVHSGAMYGEYAYCIRYVDATTGNAGTPGCLRRATTVDGNQTTGVEPMRCVWIPGFTVTMPDSADALELYRTMGGGSRYYKIATLT